MFHPFGKNGSVMARKTTTTSEKTAARFGPHRFLVTFVIARVGAPHAIWRDLEATLQAPEVGWGISALPAHGVIVRGLSHSGLTIAPALHALWNAAKLLLC